MFVDFRSFTALLRLRSPQEVVDRLDGAFGVLVDIVDRHNGIVNKFLGDGFLALFGAPFEDPHATPTRLRPHARCWPQWRDNKPAMPGPCGSVSASHAGEVVAGNIGSPRRKEYTVIGDTVNLAARIEPSTRSSDRSF